MKLKPYPEYKDSGVPWLKLLPDSWDVLRTKQVFRLRIEKAPQNNQMELLSIYTHIGVKPRRDLEQRGNKASTTDGYWIVKKGDIISNKLLAWMGAIGVSHYEGVTSPAYDILRPVRSCNTDYYHYLFRTLTYLQQFKIRSRGIMDMRLRLYFDQLGQIPIPVPPTEEQYLIVCFLNWKTAQINKFIRNKRRLIELLKEQKQNIINQAVTRGLDPNVRLKPSGVEWIGDIPEHWEGLPLRRCTKLVKTGGTPTGAGDEYFTIPGFNWFTPSDFKEDLYLTDSERQLSESGKNSVKLFPPNTVMMIGIGGTIGKVSISRNQASCNQQINGILPNKRVNTEYLAFTLRCLRNFIVSCGNFTTMPIINQDETKSLQIPVPPISEQTDIVQSIDVGSLVINQAITRAENEIEQMREYRTRLISDVVTGQVDVRDIEVPEVTEEDLLTLEDNSEVVDDDLLQEEDE